MRCIKVLEPYIPIEDIFARFAHEIDTVMLESSLQNKLGRFSIIGRAPYLKVEKRKGQLWVNDQAREEDFSAYLNDYLKANQEENPTHLPLIDGAIGFFAYDYNRDTKADFPEAILRFYDQLIIADHKEQTIHLIANGKLQDAETAIKSLHDIINSPPITLPLTPTTGVITVQPNFEKEAYKQAIDRMIGHIIEGDIYIANMTQRLDITSQRSPYEVYTRLRTKNPAPFAAYLNYKGLQIVCASPERFLQMKDRKVTTRPIKGTRKRGATEAEDEALKEELRQSEKDRSELLMIVDLERNDLNRVCVPGSVTVDELFAIESYATVHHLVSSISGTLEDGLTAIALIEHTFPGGSITGAPKIRAMEIIDELERGNRGLYTGSIGYLSLNGDCDLNIVIRTAVHSDGTYHLGVGGGITCESDLEFEYEETLQKARALLEALS